MRLFVAGIGLRGAGYPNAEQTLRILRADGVEVIELGGWFPDGLRLWSIARSLPRSAWWLLATTLRNAASLLRVLRAPASRRAPVYVPYPSLLFMSLVAFLPRRWRPFCIVDAYILAWDSTVGDRGLRRRGGWSSRFLFALERRALRAAGLVLVDTVANRTLCVEVYALDPDRVQSLPLAIDADALVAGRGRSIEQRSPGAPLKVLFVGTLVPLHGIEVIAGAIRLLAPTGMVHVRVIGDGQQAAVLERALADVPRNVVTWQREWCDASVIAAAIQDADVCLGVFGGDGKASRVLPFKLYAYLAAGRPVVSQSQCSTPEGAAAPPLLAVEPVDARHLAEALDRLANDEPLRSALAQSAGDYFDRNLGAAVIATAWRTRILAKSSA